MLLDAGFRAGFRWDYYRLGGFPAVVAGASTAADRDSSNHADGGSD